MTTDFETTYNQLRETVKPTTNDFFNAFIAFQEAVYQDTEFRPKHGATTKQKTNSRKMYWSNDDYRKSKKLHEAYKRYKNGTKVCRRIVDELHEAGYTDVEYRTDY